LKVTGTTKPNARRLAFSLVLGQAAVSTVAALLAWSIAGRESALSALLGGGISTFASLIMAIVSFARSGGAGAQRVLIALFLGEAVKVAVVIALFVVVLKTMRVVPLAMLGAYMATFLVVFGMLFANAGTAPADRESSEADSGADKDAMHGMNR
jgi:ATP synthase protein I